MRRMIWHDLAEPPRPPIDHSHHARAEAEARMARDQRLWEAAASEDSWAAWVQGEGGGMMEYERWHASPVGD